MRKKSNLKIAVSSHSFCKNRLLRSALLKAFSDVEIIFSTETSDVLAEDRLIDLAQECEALIVGREIINSSVLKNLPSLKFISKYGVGLENIDFDATKKANVEVYFESGVNSTEVAELAICLMISVLRKVALSDRNLHKGVWLKDGGTNLSGKTVGIIGCGNIGSKVAKILKAMDCHILINDLVDKTAFASSIGAEFVTRKEEIYERAHVISIHTPLTSKTKHLFSTDVFSKLRSGACLINTARGAIIDEKALVEALKNGRLLGAGLDVFEREPLTNPDLFNLENFVGTAHIGGSSSEASLKMGNAAIRGLKTMLTSSYGQQGADN